LSDELSNFAVFRIFVPSDDKLDDAGRVSEHGGGVGLGHSDQGLAVHLDDLIVHLKNEKRL